MDGLKISVSDNRISPDFSVSKSSKAESHGVTGGSDFASTLKNAIHSVDTLHKEADVQMQNLATGKSTNIHETMIATEKADIALRLMVQVRNKIIEAYQEIMRMQV